MGLQVLRPRWELSIQPLHFTQVEAKTLGGYLIQVHMASTLEVV